MKLSLRKTASLILAALMAAGTMAVAVPAVTAAQTDESAVAAQIEKTADARAEQAAREAVGAPAAEKTGYTTYTSNGFNYRLENNEAVITKYNGSAANVTIPSKLGGYKVVALDDIAFYQNEKLQTVSFPSTLRRIGRDAFAYCKSLKTVTIPASVTSIEAYAFYQCTALTSASIQGAVTNLGAYIFSGCTALKSAYIGSGTTKISNFMFHNCNAMTGLNIPNTLTTIEAYAFDYCKGFTAFTIPNSVKIIEDGAFDRCAMYNITIGNSVQKIGDFAFSWNQNLKSITLPNSLTEIGHGAFYDCNNMSSVTIGNNLKVMEEDVFSSCANLTSVSIAYGTTVIGECAFEFDSKITAITIPASVTKIGKASGTNYVDADVFYGHSKNLVIYGTYNSFAHRFANANGIAFSSSIPAVKPGSPSLTLSNKSNGIRAEWKSVTGADKYIVYFKKYGTSTWSSTETRNLYYPLLGITPGTAYNVQVQSVGAGNLKGGYSSVGTMIYIPQLQPNVSLSNKSNGIRAEWGAISGASYYIVYYKVNGTNWSSTTTKNTYFPYLNTKSGTLYCVQVQPVFNGSKGLYSSVKSLTFIATPTLSGANISQGMRLSWNAIGGANKYQIARKRAGATTYSYITTKNTYYNDTTAKAGDQYQVRAMYETQYNGTAYGYWSNIQYVK